MIQQSHPIPKDLPFLKKPNIYTKTLHVNILNSFIHNSKKWEKAKMHIKW